MTYTSYKKSEISEVKMKHRCVGRYIFNKEYRILPWVGASVLKLEVQSVSLMHYNPQKCITYMPVCVR